MQIDIDIATYEISSDIAKRGNPTNLGSKKGGKGFKRGIPTIVGSKYSKGGRGVFYDSTAECLKNQKPEILRY